MLAQRKEVSWDNHEQYRELKLKKSIKVQKQNKNLNDALRSRCIVLFVIVSILAGFLFYVVV